MRPLSGTWPTTQACALTGNPTGNPLVHRPALNHLATPAKSHLLELTLWREKSYLESCNVPLSLKNTYFSLILPKIEIILNFIISTVFGRKLSFPFCTVDGKKSGQLEQDITLKNFFSCFLTGMNNLKRKFSHTISLVGITLA